MIQTSGMSLKPFPPVFSPYKEAASKLCLCIFIQTDPENSCTIFIRRPFTDNFLKDQSIKSSTYLLTFPQLYFWNKSNNPSKEPGNSSGVGLTMPSSEQFGNSGAAMWLLKYPKASPNSLRWSDIQLAFFSPQFPWTLCGFCWSFPANSINPSVLHGWQEELWITQSQITRELEHRACSVMCSLTGLPPSFPQPCHPLTPFSPLDYGTSSSVLKFLWQ